MGKIFDSIDGPLRRWIERQALFFVGTAPLDGDGHVNLSPKGPIGSLRVLDDHAVAYLDVVGSGAETIAHLRENGRIVIMFCAFEGPPRILRLHGRGEVLLPHDPRYADLLARCGFDDPSSPAARRSIVRVDVTRIADSCGFGVPLMAFEGSREHHRLTTEKALRVQGPQAIADYICRRNAESIDGIAAVPPETLPAPEAERGSA
jgi:hypothetical protein